MRSQQMALLRACFRQGSLLQQASTTLGSTSSSLHTIAGSLADKQQQQSSKPQLPGGVPKLGDMFASRKLPVQVRHAHGGPPPYEGPDPWPQLRASYNTEVPNDVGSSLYTVIMTFGFSWLLLEEQGLTGFPPRVLGIMSLLMLVFYTRRGHFAAFKDKTH